jgi:DNA polymerase elongation subunit (family B)
MLVRFINTSCQTEQLSGVQLSQLQAATNTKLRHESQTARKHRSSLVKLVGCKKSQTSIHRRIYLFIHCRERNDRELLVAGRLKKHSSQKVFKECLQKVLCDDGRDDPDTVCMQESDFYVDTIHCFRDLFCEYKKMTKSWKKKSGYCRGCGSQKEAEDHVLVYDSLRVTRKCILNSVYGYMMRKGACWRSMEMASIVTKTGADSITQARILVKQIGYAS